MAAPEHRHPEPSSWVADPEEAPPGDLELTRRQVIFASGGVLAASSLTPVQSDAQTQTAPLSSDATQQIRLTINGKPVELRVDLRQSLLDVLREQLALTGTKKGCNQGACGACTVLLQGRRVNACLTLAAMHDGAEITTVEGLAEGGRLHPLQSAFIEHEGFQCGYCTAGQLMSGVACIKEGHAGTPDEVRAWMSGNICRCGAYPGIVSAIVEVGRRQPS